jgi:hypothetical protein
MCQLRHRIQKTQTVGKRSGAESGLVRGAKSEFQELARTVIGEFDKQIRAHRRGSFLNARPVNVRIVRDGSYSSISSMIGDMESRRDSREDVLRARILSLEMQLVKSLNAVGAAALGH